MRVNDPGACSGMVGCLYFLELVMDLLGLLVLMKLWLIYLRVLWVLILLILCRVGMLHQGVDWDSAADRMFAHPDVWTDGSLVRDEVSGSAFAGAGVYARLHVDTWRYRRWWQFDNLGLTPDGLAPSCVGFSSLPGPLQAVLRAEFLGGDFGLAGHECCSSGC